MRLACVVLLLAGCATPIEPTPWTHASDPWVAYSYGCGFCSGDPQTPEFRAVILYDTGQFMGFDYARETEGVWMEPGTETWTGAVEQAVAAFALYAEAGVRVHGVQTDTLTEREMNDVRTAIKWGLSRAQEPSQHDTVTDCGAQLVESPGVGIGKVGCGWDSGPGWARVHAAMQDLDARLR